MITSIETSVVAVVFHNTLEEGQVDSLSAHGELAFLLFK